MTSRLPKSFKVLTVQKSPTGRKPVYHDAVLEERPLPLHLNLGEVLVKITAAAFNHKDLWIRKGQQPGYTFGSVLGADGAGIVIASGNKDDPLLNKRVFLVPMRGWEKDPEAPEKPFYMIGNGAKVPIGAFAHYAVVERDQVILTPEHLDDVHMSAWPLGGVTAWRAVVLNARVQSGDNVLITGIGGGVALLALQLCVALGANVYVTSGSEDKIRRATALGAKGGVSYKDADWPGKLHQLMKQDATKLPGKPTAPVLLNAVIDSAGGDLVGRVNKILKSGGRIVVYGMTASPKMTLTMREVLKNHQLIGSTMGSHKDLIDATNFIAKHGIVPVVSTVMDGLEAAEEGFELIKRGEQFGKVVIRMKHDTAEQHSISAKL